MPNLRNAIKQLRKDKKKSYDQLMLRSNIRTAIKNARKAIETGDATIDQQLQAIQVMLDKAAKKNIIKKNTAARKLSRLYAFKKKKTNA
jgi:small subunit ribosomal protein S20